ncbi:basic salivary proline-rich protein 4 [Bubalus bubalis]|uniref:basic salivary proline-rich protein 4 n=1 Tax=Bubalus bubalis TaxID=89462 RepID=UPI001D12AD39|nr:basic salivary proline-rich protein 4 [Bubalus bubalis]
MGRPPRAPGVPRSHGAGKRRSRPRQSHRRARAEEGGGAPNPERARSYPAVAIGLLHLLGAGPPPHQRPQQPHVPPERSPRSPSCTPPHLRKGRRSRPRRCCGCRADSRSPRTPRSQLGPPRPARPGVRTVALGTRGAPRRPPARARPAAPCRRPGRGPGGRGAGREPGTPGAHRGHRPLSPAAPEKQEGSARSSSAETRAGRPRSKTRVTGGWRKPLGGSLYLRSLDGCTGGSHQPGSDSAAACQTQSRPAAMARVPSPNRPPQPRSPQPRPEPGLPPHPAPSVPAQRVKPRRGEPQASYRKTHRGTVGQILMEKAFRMGEMWREGWGRRGTSHLGQKPQRAYPVPAPERPSGHKAPETGGKEGGHNLWKEDTAMKTQQKLGIFPTQGSNPGLPHSWQMLYPLSHHGSQHHDSSSEANHKRPKIGGIPILENSQPFTETE